ncbi:MAG: hypothetical protein KTR31_40470 [Myxococcales bacterium]|nr:hypothetical protein [Myxococcales bacterium]
MHLVDFLIGFFLMNAMPHFVLGVWRGRILSLFGTSPGANLAYSAVCFSVSMGLFLWAHGLAGFGEQPIYTGALTILVIYYLTGHFFHRLFAPPPSPAE